MSTRQMIRVVAGLLATCSVAAVVGCASHTIAPAIPADAYVAPVFLRLGAAPSPLVAPLASGPGSSGRRLRSTTSVDGRIGGTISLGRFHVEVPPGAFDECGDITITIEDSLVLQCDLDISPGHLNAFKVPVLLHVSCAGAINLVDPATLAIVRYEPENDWWREVEGTAPNVLTIEAAAPLQHFSRYGVVQSKAGW